MSARFGWFWPRPELVCWCTGRNSPVRVLNPYGLSLDFSSTGIVPALRLRRVPVVMQCAKQAGSPTGPNHPMPEPVEGSLLSQLSHPRELSLPALRFMRVRVAMQCAKQAGSVRDLLIPDTGVPAPTFHPTTWGFCHPVTPIPPPD